MARFAALSTSSQHDASLKRRGRIAPSTSSALRVVERDAAPRSVKRFQISDEDQNALSVVPNRDVYNTDRPRRPGRQFEFPDTSGATGQPEDQLLCGEVACVDRFRHFPQVSRERRRERPIYCLTEPDPQGKWGRGSLPALDLADPCPLHADAGAKLLLRQAELSSRSTQVRAEHECDAIGFPITVEFVVGSPPPHRERVAAASLPRVTHASAPPVSRTAALTSKPRVMWDLGRDSGPTASALGYS